MANRKTGLFREVNENMKDVLRGLEVEEAAEFFCECPLRECSRRITLTRVEYDAVRRTGWFLASPDCRRWPRELLRTESYVVVKDFGPWLESVTGARPESSPAEPAADPESSPESAPMRRRGSRATSRPVGVGR
jgi:hypothetical protein